MICKYIKPSTHIVTYIIVRSKSNRRFNCNQYQPPDYNSKTQPSYKENKDLIVTNHQVSSYDKKFDYDQPSSSISRAMVIEQ